MNVLTAEQLSRSYGEREIFSDLGFGIQRGQKVGLIAKNGTGKTSLMRILSGQEAPDSGQVVVREGFRLGFLEQSPELEAGKTILESLLPRQPELLQTLHAYRAATESGDMQALEQSMSKMDALQAWDAETRIREMTSKLGLGEVNMRTDQLSGGQKRRLALAGLLCEAPDILLLDEPTNHLDIPMIEWLEGYLSQSNLSLLMVTHDRYFLDRVCDHIWELEEGKLHQYQGNFGYYLEKKAQREAAEASSQARAKNLYSRELEWVRRMPKARGTKSKSRLKAFEEVKAEALKRRNQSRLEVDIPMQRLGSKIVEAIKISKSYGVKPLFEEFRYSFRKGERLAVVGPNGSGKTTLLKILTGQLEPDQGKVVVGDTVAFGWYAQELDHLPGDKRVIEFIKETAEYFETERRARVSASFLLDMFEFPPSMQYQYIHLLSGGEKRRLSLLHMLLKQPNFLILDEPTNDLDIATLQSLEWYLEAFEGCVLVVSHDRHFVDKVADQLIVLDGTGGIDVFGGSYSEWQAFLAEQKDAEQVKKKENQAPISAKQEGPSGVEKRGRLSYNEERKLAALPDEIEALEKEKERLEKAMLATQEYTEQIGLSESLGKISKELQEAMDLWLSLEEKKEGLA